MKFSPSSNREHLKAITKATSRRLMFKSDAELMESLKSLSDKMNFDEPDGEFNTILYLAAANNHVKTVGYLLSERKVNPNVKVSENLTAAHIAATKGHNEVLEKLVRCEGIKLAEKDKYGETPLFRAIGNAPYEKLLDTVRLIIMAAPDTISVTNEDGISPIELALQRQHPSVIQLLLENGANVNKKCSIAAAEMMMSRSVPTRQFDGAFVFFAGSSKNDNLRQCAKLIIEAYNKQHLAEDLREMTASSNAGLSK